MCSCWAVPYYVFTEWFAPVLRDEPKGKTSNGTYEIKISAYINLRPSKSIHLFPKNIHIKLIDSTIANFIILNARVNQYHPPTEVFHTDVKHGELNL